MEQAYLENGGTALLVDLRDGDAVIVHWGDALPAPLPDAALLLPAVPRSNFDVPIRPSLVPQASRGWRGAPGLSGARDDGSGYSPLLTVRSADATATRLDLELEDAVARLRVRIGLELDAHGILHASAELENASDAAYRLVGLELALPLPARAAEVLDHAGRWGREKQQQRHGIAHGEWVRAGRHGRTGHDATGLFAAGTAGFGFGRGEVWGIHLAWSGDHRHRVERLGDGQTVIAAGELLHPGEVVLGAGERYTAPELLAAHSTEGLDGVSARFHRMLRARPTHPRTPRPVVLNTWEAVYFRHDLDELSRLAETAAAVGVERFVLDDGWFRGRRDDHAGLGDWVVDADVWPQGLGPLIERVEALGMRFGLWVEPEMVNEDSDLVRAHPDWIAGPAGRRSLEWRHQQVLDLVNPDAFAHVLGQLDALLSENQGIAFLKWDQNRDQTELGSGGRASTHAQTLAAYRMLDELRRRHPDVEIESCSSGGARVDLGVLARTDRVWASDTNDALERQLIQRGTQALIPPELVGAHIGPAHSHTTGRTQDLSFRAITALVGHFGIEWDILRASDAERAELAQAIAYYRDRRELLHSGRLVHADDRGPSSTVYGVVADDRSEAVFVVAQLTLAPDEQTPPATLPGLDPARRYRVRFGLPLDERGVGERGAPAWIAAGGELELTGAALAVIGVPVPALLPEHALLLDVREVR
ncbi:alpha-galactosidase [Pseudolysinimonas kribbensis]|uniref:alpha-galactosidase n=2 Tax=Pseudolysinimonas kribbensis TaxID=433641 RepID=A0ABQ6K9S6_9MICO|nr:alpha-galactosidase [Pseudolysinimonas kribbensis]GMA95725.1 alpha-galactosidase [Pseudolysinimonas kribbensis]